MVGHGEWQHKPCVERRYTLSADKLPVCLPELGLSGKKPVSYKDIFNLVALS
jgi:hypothetical protein